MRKNLINATLINSHEISAIYLTNFTPIDNVNFFLVGDGEKRALTKAINNRQSITEIRLVSEKEIKLGFDYVVMTSDEERVYLDYDEYVESEEFDNLYAYNGDDLGITYKKSETTFKIWSPLSDKVILKLEKNDNDFEFFEMIRGECGVYEVTVKGNLLLKKYNFIVRVNGREQEIRDPYGKAVSLNSLYSSIIDISTLNKIKKVKPKSEFKKYTDAIIYEVNIRDFTEKTSFENKGTYLGFLNKVDYLEKLGITHVQLQPILDFAGVDDIVKNTYNWGYDPISFFALEGSYSSLPEDPMSRLIEFKTLVSELHKHNIRVVIDVVYNHLYEYATSDFQRNVPYYYFRKYKNKMCNASGCGNDLATERKMVRKIILDSVRHLLETFDVDGLRFDLMGLIDIDTTQEIINLAKQIKPDVILYGEGWHMGTNLPDDKKSSSANAYKLLEMGFFNDTFRDLIKGETFNKLNKGYISGNIEYKNQVELVISGSVFNGKFTSVSQSINYVECHDNQTLYDKLAEIYTSEEDILRMVKFANALTVLSLGVPFIHMGQEIGLSKFGVDNSYNIPKINSMDWDKVEERADLVNYFADLTALRKKAELFRIDDKERITETFDFFQLENGVLTIAVRDEALLVGNKKGLILINPLDKAMPVNFDEFYNVYFSVAGNISSKKLTVKNYIAPPSTLSVFVLKK